MAVLRNAGPRRYREEVEEQPAKVGSAAFTLSGHLPGLIPQSRPPWTLDALGNFFERTNIRDNLLSSAQQPCGWMGTVRRNLKWLKASKG